MTDRQQPQQCLDDIKELAHCALIQYREDFKNNHLETEELFEALEQIEEYASHSSATECPAQAVLDSAIADLEREIKDQQWMIDNYSGHHKEIHESISKALRYSLNLLRGGAHD